MRKLPNIFPTHKPNNDMHWFLGGQKGGSGGSNNPYVQAYLDKHNTEGYTLPSQSKIDILNSAFNSPEGQSEVPKIDLLGTLYVENVNSCKIPLIHSGGATKRFSLVSSPAFTAGKGLKSNGGGYLNTDWTPSVNAINYQINSGSLGGHTDYTLASAPDVYMMGALSAEGFSIIQAKNSDNGEAVAIINNTSESISFPVPSPGGFSSASINGSTASIIKNGGLLGTESQTPTGLPTVPVYVCCPNFLGNATVFFEGDVQYFYYGSGTINQAKLNTFLNMLLL